MVLGKVLQVFSFNGHVVNDLITGRVTLELFSPALVHDIGVYGLACIVLQARLLAELALYGFHGEVLTIAGSLFVFYAAFNLLEAILPSLIAKMAPADSKGTAMGFYSSAQFFGAFVGGAMGGWLHGRFGLETVFLFNAAVALVWLVFAASMKNPRYLSTRLLRVGRLDPPAARKLAQDVAAGRLTAESIDTDRFAGALSTAGQPDPDLLIRTGGEMRISNFLLWQSAYTELYFTPTLWPDFGAAELDRAIGAFQARERRFGKTGDQARQRNDA